MQHASFSLQIKSLADTGVIEGVASDPTVDSYGESVAPGAFALSLAEYQALGRAPAMLLHHDTHRPIGKWTDLEERDSGLLVRGRLTMEATDARDAYALLKDGALSGLSIGYWVKKKKEGANGVTILQELDLVEISLVTLPANPNARISAVKAITGARDIADLLREAGISGRRAKAAAGAAWKAINESDDEAAAETELAALFRESAARLSSMGGR